MSGRSKNLSGSSGKLVTTKAIVISSLKYGDADLIVKCFTESDGLKSYLLRNILSSKKGKLRTSMFQALTQLEIVANHKEKQALQYIREAKNIYPYQTLQTQIHKSAVAIFLSEVLRNSIQEEEANPVLYHFLEEALLWLENNTHTVDFHLLFLLKLTKFLGFYPHDFHADENRFNLLEGVFQQSATNEYCVGGENVFILKQLRSMDFDDLSGLSLSQSKRNGFLEMILLYYQLHLQGFRKPKSLEVLNEVFG